MYFFHKYKALSKQCNLYTRKFNFEHKALRSKLNLQVTLHVYLNYIGHVYLNYMSTKCLNKRSEYFLLTTFIHEKILTF